MQMNTWSSSGKNTCSTRLLGATVIEKKILMKDWIRIGFESRYVMYIPSDQIKEKKNVTSKEEKSKREEINNRK